MTVPENVVGHPSRSEVSVVAISVVNKGRRAIAVAVAYIKYGFGYLSTFNTKEDNRNTKLATSGWIFSGK